MKHFLTSAFVDFSNFSLGEYGQNSDWRLISWEFGVTADLAFGSLQDGFLDNVVASGISGIQSQFLANRLKIVAI